MRTATVRDLRNRYTSLLRWLKAGEDILITQKGKTVARLIPEQEQTPSSVNWADSPAVKRTRRASKTISAKEAKDLIHQAGGRW